MLEQKKTPEAIGQFEAYRQGLQAFLSDKKFKNAVSEELTYSFNLFISRLSQTAEKYLTDNDYSNALLCYTYLFKHKQSDINIIKNYINCLDKLELFDLEAEIALFLETLNPDDMQVCKLLSEIYNNNKDNSKSIYWLEKYFKLKNSDITADEYNLLGCYYNKLYSDDTHKYEDIIKSLENFEKALELVPFGKIFLKNATIMASKANDYETALKCWNRLLEIGNLSNDDKYDYAAFCLRNGDFDGWHKYFGARFAKENNRTRFPEIAKREWDGVSSDKFKKEGILLVHYEQGFGDSFLMWGYIPRLVQLASQVIFVCQDGIYELLKDNDFGVKVISASDADLNKIKFDYYLPSMSIPAVLKLNRDTISVGGGYIKANPELTQDFKYKYFDNNKFKIGISFHGSSTGNISRDIPVESFLPLDNLKNAEIYSLTKDVSDDEFKCFRHNKVNNIAKYFKNFAYTAAAIENCDVIITSDNCILNLSGALGKKTLALFNWHYEFRYFDLTGNDIVWYSQVKPFVNDKIDNWTYSINNAIKEIEHMRV